MLGPIFMRELVTVPRRGGHYAGRARPLGLLGILGITTWQATVGFTRDATLGETAAFGLLLFQIVAFVQLLLTLFFAALSAAGAVSQEKDRRTFVLLLLTDMRDYEIVLGKLLGALLPILDSAARHRRRSSRCCCSSAASTRSRCSRRCWCSLATAVAAGSLGGLVALWRERDVPGAGALGAVPRPLHLPDARRSARSGRCSPPASTGPTVQAWLDPFVAMQTVLDPPAGGWGGLAPAYGFVLVMLAWCALLNGIGIWKLRKWNPSGEPIMQREATAGEDPEPDESIEAGEAGEGPRGAGRSAAGVGEPDPVARNPHARLRPPAAAGEVAFGIVLALILYFAVSELNRPGGRPAFAAAYGLVRSRC